MTDYEKLLTDSSADDYVAWYDKAYKNKRINKRWDFMGRIAGITIIIYLVVSLWQCNLRSNTSTKNNNLITRQSVYTVIERTHSQVADRDKNGVINCVDYSITFKREWDKLYDNSCCELVHNYNAAKNFNHVLVRVKINNEWIMVEPQTTGSDFSPEGYWPVSYDSKYNIYGKTAEYLRRDKL